MTWDTQITRSGVRKAACLELVLDGGTYYFADTDLREPDKFWVGRIKSMSNITRTLDPTNRGMNIADVTVTLINHDDDSTDIGYFESLMQSETLDNREANVYLKFVEDDGTVVSEKIFSGIAIPGSLSGDGLTFTLTIRNALKAKLGILQRTINDIAHTSAPDGSAAGYPESTLGWGQNVVAGKVASNRGAVRCVMIDDTADSEQFLVTQGGCYDITDVYRKRSDAFTKLTLTTHYTVTLYAKDAEGNAYSYIELTAGQWQEGDELYANVEGIPGEGYCTFDGTNDYISGTGLTLPAGMADAFTVEVKVKNDLATMDSDRMYLTIFDGTTPTRILYMYCDNPSDNYRFIFRNNDDTEYVFDATTQVQNTSTDTIRLCYDGSGPTLKVFLDGVEETLQTVSGTLSGDGWDLNPDDVDIGIGARADTGGGKWDGRAYSAVFAEGYQIPSNGGTNDDTDPLENIATEYRLFYPYQNTNWYIEDLQGDNTLTCTSLTDADFTLVSLETNPAWCGDRLLRWPWYDWQLPCSDIDRASFATAAAECTTRGYDTANYFGYLVPESQKSIEQSGNQWTLLADYCRNFGHCAVIARDGQLEVKTIDITSTTSDTIPQYREKDGMFALPGVAIEKWRAFDLVNEVYAKYAHSHHDYEDSCRGYNTESQTQFNLTVTKHWSYRGAQDFSMVEDLLERDLALVSGQTSLVSFGASPGLSVLQDGSDVADYIALTCKRPNDWDEQQSIVISSSVNPVGGAGSVKCLPAQSHVGSVVVEEGASEPTGETLVASVSTFVGETGTWCGSNGHTDAKGTSSYGTQDYLRHGHHYGQTGTAHCVDHSPPCVPYESDANDEHNNLGVKQVPLCGWNSLGYSNVNWRSLLRYSFSGWAGRTIVSASVRLYVIQAPSLIWGYTINEEVVAYYPSPQCNNQVTCDFARSNADIWRSGWSGSTLHRCTETAFTTSSTWQGLSWSDGTDISTNLGTLGSGTGLKYVTLNAAGIAYLQDAVNGSADGGSGDEVNLTLGAFGAGDSTKSIKIASTRHSNADWKPALIITYT